MAEENFPSQENHEASPNPEDLDEVKAEIDKADDIAEKEGLLVRGVEEEEEIEEEGVELEKRPETTQESPIDDWRNEVEKMDKFKHFTRTDIAEMIDNGASDEEIWEAAKNAGVFFKFDGSSYYLSNREQKDRDKDDEGTQNKYQWRRRSANNNTSGGYQEGNMFGHIKRELGLYRDLQDAYPSLKDAFAAANMLQAYGEKLTRNKILSMSEYWDEIKSASPESTAETREKSEPSEEPAAEAEEVISEEEYKKFINEGVVTDSVMDHVAEKVKNSEELTDKENEIFTDKTSEINEKIKEIAETEEASSEKSQSGAEDKEQQPKTPESAEEISKGDKVYYMEKEMRRWRDPKEIIAIKEVDEENYAKFADDDSLYPVKKLALAESSAEDKDYQPEGAEEAIGVIDQSVAESFSEQFSISAEDLETVPGFTDLSAGQQQLVLENFRKLTLSRIEEEGVKQYRENINNAGAFSSMWQGFLSSYYKAGATAEAGEELLSGGIDMHKEALADVVKQTKESGLDLDDDGHIVFISEDPFDDLSMEDVEVINRLNQAAQSFAETSDSWRYEDTLTENISGSTREEYQERREEYRSALHAYIDFARERKGAEGVREAMEIDKKVRFSQFFAGDEDYESALQKIKDEPKWRRTMDNILAEKGGYMLLGGASRTLSYGTLGAVAAPLTAIFTAAGLGAYRARRKAIESLEDEALVRQGGGDSAVSRNVGTTFATMGKAENKADVINTVPARQLTEKLRNLLDKLGDPELDSEEKQTLKKQLSRRVQYTTQKIEGGTYVDENGEEYEYAGGLVDYGDADGRPGRKYDLLQTLSEAQALDLLNNDPDIKDDISDRLDRYLNYKDEKTRSYVTEKSARGAVFGASFAGIGASIADFFTGGEGVESAPDTEVFSGGTGDVDSSDVDSAVNNPFETGGDSIGTDTTETNPLETGGDSVEVESKDIETEKSDSSAVDSAKAGPLETGADSTAEDSAGAEPSQPDSATADSAETNPLETGGESVEADLIGSETITIDEDGEGMIHAIADKLEDEYNLSHDKAMEVGNQLYVKGEQLEGDDEMFNLVGKGASFDLDFGDLQAADLESQSAEDLAEAIDFDNTEVDPGDSGVEPELEVPKPPQDAPEYSGEGSEAATTGQYEDNPVEHIDQVDVPSAAEAQNMSDEELESWKQELKEEGIIIDEDNTSGSSESADVEAGDENTPDEASSGESAAGTETGEAEIPENMTEDQLREAVTQEETATHINNQIEALLQKAEEMNSSSFGNISVDSLNSLQDYLQEHSDQNLITTIEDMSDDDPRLLLTLDQVVEVEDNPPGGLMDQLDQFISEVIADKSDEIGQSLEEEAAVAEAHADAVSSADADTDTKEKILDEAERLEDKVREFKRHTGYGDKVLDRLSALNDLLR